jgi:hypothetical protein
LTIAGQSSNQGGRSNEGDEVVEEHFWLEMRVIWAVGKRVTMCIDLKEWTIG